VKNPRGLDAIWSIIAVVLSPADIFPGGGGVPADVFAIALSVGLFALVYWAIDLIDRI
jgi:hypothetical protein